jgi:integrase
MATIRQRRPGVWEVRVFSGNDARGRPTQISRTVHGSRRAAERAAAQLELRPAMSAARTVAEVLDLWLDHNRATWTPQSERDQVSRVAQIKNDPIAAMRLARLGVADVERWHAGLRRAGAGEGSIRNQHQALRAALTLAVRWGWIVSNPAAVARLGQRKASVRGSLSPDEVRRAIEAAASFDPAAAVALRLAAMTGARRGELAALRWEDLQGDRLTIDSSMAIIRYGDRATNTKPVLRDDPTKTGNRRTVTLDPATLSMLASLGAEREPWGRWILAVGERPVNPERITAWWRRAAGIAGLDPKWRLHDLRHWSATTAIAAGHDIRTVANRLGHANPAMTLRVYAHAVESADIGVAATLAASLDREPN